MTQKETTRITIETLVNAPADQVWDYWTAPEHITKWNQASADWHSPRAENDLRTGGRFSSRMEAKDGSMGFDFEGVYDEVTPSSRLAYTMSDDRKVSVDFKPQGTATRVTETFEAEHSNSVEMQRDGWQAILDNFKKYVESLT